MQTETQTRTNRCNTRTQAAKADKTRQGDETGEQKRNTGDTGNKTGLTWRKQTTKREGTTRTETHKGGKTGETQVKLTGRSERCGEAQKTAGSEELRMKCKDKSTKNETGNH